MLKFREYVAKILLLTCCYQERSKAGGKMLGKFGLWWKRSLYEDSVRIPMIVAGPGFAAGRRVETPVDLHDL